MWINALVQAIDRSATPGENDILFGGGSATSVGNAIVCVCFDCLSVFAAVLRLHALCSRSPPRSLAASLSRFGFIIGL